LTFGTHAAHQPPRDPGYGAGGTGGREGGREGGLDAAQEHQDADNLDKIICVRQQQASACLDNSDLYALVDAGEEDNV